MTKPSEVEVSLSDLGKIKFDRIRSDLQKTKTKTMLIIHRDHMKVNVCHVCLYKVVKQNANFRSQKAKISKWIIESLLIVITINIDSFWCLREYSLGTFIQCVIHMNVRWSSLRKTLHSSHRNNIRRLAFRSVLSNLDLPVVFCFGYIIPKAVIIIIFTMLGVFQIVYIVEMEKVFSIFSVGWCCCWINRFLDESRR